jgi:ABC-2 type transport system permease protein
LKLKNYRTFWILTSLYLLSIGGINFIVFWIQQKIFEEKQSKGIAELVIGNRQYSFPTVWQMTAYVSGFLLFLPGLLMIIFITNEFSYKTHRQNIIDGWSRNQFISVKLVLAFLVSLLSTLIVVIAASIFGSQLNNPFSFERFQFVGYYFMEALSYTLVSVIIAILVRRGGLAIGIYFMYAVVLENVIAKVMNHFLNDTGKFLPLESADELIPLPVFESIQRQLIKPPDYPILLTTVGIYICLYVFFINRKFLKSDL